MSKITNGIKMAAVKTWKVLKISFRYLKNKQLLVPLAMLLVLVVFNFIMDTRFFHIGTAVNSAGNIYLQGRILSILNYGSEVAILAIGMTFITSACGGQDISVGAGAAISASVALSLFLNSGSLLLALIVCIVVSVIFSVFNGALVSYFKLLPMVATLILFTAGRKIAYWIGGGQIMIVPNGLFKYFGSIIPGVPIPTPILITAVCIAIIFLLLKFTNLRLYTESVGINEKAARLNGIRPTNIKMLSFIILGFCVAISGFISISRITSISYETIAGGIEMDVILAVAIGGTVLGGGKFNLVGSIIGAYIIELLTNTLYSLNFVSSESIRFYKAVFVIILVILGSPVVKEKLSAFWAKTKSFIDVRKADRNSNIEKEGV